jgi:hypothetical protein
MIVNCRIPCTDDLIAYGIAVIGIFFIFTFSIEVNAQEPAESDNQPAEQTRLGEPQEDTTPPVITVPEDIITKARPNEGSATVSFEVSAEDDIDGAVDVTCDHNSGDQFRLDETSVTCTAEDSSGNRAEESFTITVLGSSTTLVPGHIPAQGGPAQGGPAQGGPAQGGPAQGGPAQGGPANNEPQQFSSDMRIDVFNQNTTELLSNYILVQTVPDRFAEQEHGIPGQFVTTIAFQDRYGRQESNNNLNVFLQITHTNDMINSMRGIQLGGDSIMATSSISGNTMSLPRSVEIEVPPSEQPVAVPQKTRDVLNRDLEPPETPIAISDFLDTRIDLLNKATTQHLVHYILVQTVPDRFAEQEHGIPGQFVTTIAFQDRYGRQESNNNLNVFLQITHTNDEVTSLRAVQLGGDDIQIVVDGIDQGTLPRSVEI